MLPRGSTRPAWLSPGWATTRLEGPAGPSRRGGRAREVGERLETKNPMPLAPSRCAVRACATVSTTPPVHGYTRIRSDLSQTLHRICTLTAWLPSSVISVEATRPRPRCHPGMLRPSCRVRCPGADAAYSYNWGRRLSLQLPRYGVCAYCVVRIPARDIEARAVSDGARQACSAIGDIRPPFFQFFFVRMDGGPFHSFIWPSAEETVSPRRDPVPSAANVIHVSAPIRRSSRRAARNSAGACSLCWGVMSDSSGCAGQIPGVKLDFPGWRTGHAIQGWSDVSVCLQRGLARVRRRRPGIANTPSHPCIAVGRFSG